MKILAVLLPVLTILTIEVNCGVVDRVYDGAVGAVNTTREAIGGMLSFGKDLVFGKNDPNPDKETGRHSDGIVGGFMNTIHSGAGIVRNGVSKVMDYEHSLREKVVGVFTHKSDKASSNGQVIGNEELQNNKSTEPAYHHGEGLIDVRMVNDFNKDVTNNLNNNRDYINGVNSDIYDKIDDDFESLKGNVNEYSHNAIDSAKKVKDNAVQNIRSAKDQLNKNIDNLRTNGRSQVEDLKNSYMNTMEKENEMLNTLSNKANEGSIVFGDIVKDSGSLDKLSYGNNKKK